VAYGEGGGVDDDEHFKVLGHTQSVSYSLGYESGGAAIIAASGKVKICKVLLVIETA
jgi:hypothetical protein